jgi:conjugative transfer region lipoprotein (TIGR03751 family)
MAWNNAQSAHSLSLNRSKVTVTRSALLALCVLALSACSVSGPRESPLNEVTAGSPTVSEVFRGTDGGQTNNNRAKERFNTSGQVRPVGQLDAQQSPYWSPLAPMKQRFARVPNPDMVMVVYPHLSRGKYPVPGYVTVFPMYEQTQYALPGEVEQEDGEARERYMSPPTETSSVR